MSHYSASTKHCHQSARSQTQSPSSVHSSLLATLPLYKSPQYRTIFQKITQLDRQLTQQLHDYVFAVENTRLASQLLTNSAATQVHHTPSQTDSLR